MAIIGEMAAGGVKISLAIKSASQQGGKCSASAAEKAGESSLA